MYNVTGANIILTRGDTLLVQVEITKDGEPYIPEEGDVVRFALKRELFNADRTDYLDENPLVLKVIPNDTLILRLDSIDTKDLEFGKYVFDIQITFADGTVDTFIFGKLKLTPEVD